MMRVAIAASLFVLSVLLAHRVWSAPLPASAHAAAVQTSRNLGPHDQHAKPSRSPIVVKREPDAR